MPAGLENMLVNLSVALSPCVFDSPSVFSKLRGAALLPAAVSSRLPLPCWRLNRLRVSRLHEACNRWMPGSEFIAEAQMNALRKMMESVDVDQHRSFGCFALDAARSGIGDR
jgi:hypothetical protein